MNERGEACLEEPGHATLAPARAWEGIMEEQEKLDLTPSSVSRMWVRSTEGRVSATRARYQGIRTGERPWFRLNQNAYAEAHLGWKTMRCAA
jgi:hypothetical protein